MNADTIAIVNAVVEKDTIAIVDDVVETVTIAIVGADTIAPVISDAFSTSILSLVHTEMNVRNEISSGNVRALYDV